MTSGLGRAEEQLEKAERILNEVNSIGVWTRSDGCSDNRLRRKLLREAGWEVSDAARAIAALEQKSEAVAQLEQDVRAVAATLEQLPETVSDIMADDDLGFTVALWTVRDRVEKLKERCRELSSVD